MATRGVSFISVYTAWDTVANSAKTGDSANHTLRWIKDGVSSALTNTPTEVDSVNCPGEYKVTVTADESDCLHGSLCGKSTTSGVVILPVSYGFELSEKPMHTGLVASTTGTETALDSNASTVANIYLGARLYIVSGTGAGQERIITAYSSLRVATHADWETDPDTTSTFVVVPARTSLTLSSGSSTVFSEDASASEVAICNMALSHIGVSKEITNLQTETSQEAAACRRFYAIARDSALREFSWPFATKIASLGLVEEDPNEEWQFSYRVPSDCITVRRVLSGNRNDTKQSKVPFKQSGDSAGLVIYTDQEDAEIEYTFKETDPTRYPSDFQMALSLRLASYIAPRLSRGDPFNVGNRALTLHSMDMFKAKSMAGNEEQPDEENDSEFTRGRE